MDIQQQLQQILSSQAGQYGSATSPLLLPRMQVAQVDGESGARSLAMGPDSSCLALDKSYKAGLLVWFIQTDQAGNKVTVMDYDMTPHVHEAPPDFNKLQSLMESMAAKLDQQSAAFDDLTKRVNSMEEAFK